MATGRTLTELVNTMSGAEFAMWKAYHSIRPFGETAHDLRIGTEAPITKMKPEKRKPGPTPWWVLKARLMRLFPGTKKG